MLPDHAMRCSCWALARYSKWILGNAEAGQRAELDGLVAGLCERVLDPNRRVQEAACSGLAILIEAGPGISHYQQQILQTLAAAVQRYGRRTLRSAYDVINTLAEAVPACLAGPHSQLLLALLFAKWGALGDGDRDVLPLMECLTSVVSVAGEARGRAFSDMVTPFGPPPPPCISQQPSCCCPVTAAECQLFPLPPAAARSRALPSPTASVAWRAHPRVSSPPSPLPLLTPSWACVFLPLSHCAVCRAPGGAVRRVRLLPLRPHGGGGRPGSLQRRLRPRRGGGLHRGGDGPAQWPGGGPGPLDGEPGWAQQPAGHRRPRLQSACLLTLMWLWLPASQRLHLATCVLAEPRGVQLSGLAASHLPVSFLDLPTCPPLPSAFFLLPQGPNVVALVLSFLTSELLLLPQDPNAEVRQSAFALVGDLAKACAPHIKPAAPQIIASALYNLEPQMVTQRSMSVCINACWSLGELAIKCSGPELAPAALQVWRCSRIDFLVCHAACANGSDAATVCACWGVFCTDRQIWSLHFLQPIFLLPGWWCRCWSGWQ